VRFRARAAPHRLAVLGLAVTTAAGLFATVMHRVHGCPRPPFSFGFRKAFGLVAFFDVLSLTLLFVGVFIFVTAGHLPHLHASRAQTICHVTEYDVKGALYQRLRDTGPCYRPRTAAIRRSYFDMITSQR
jgi:hypothetical protein